MTAVALVIIGVGIGFVLTLGLLALIGLTDEQEEP